jgi:soluble P-type ATPase
LGVLFKGGEPLELTGKADVVVFDKTGTLTEGKPSVQRASTTILRREDVLRIASEKEWWALVGALAHESEHLMSRAIAAYAQQQQQENPLNPLQQQSSTSSSSSSSGANQQVVPFEAVARFEAVSGAGCRGEVKGRVIMIGNQRWLESQGVALSAEEIDVMDDVQTAGNIAVLVAIDGVLSGIVTLCDAVKAEAQGTVRALQARGIEVFMLTGDNARTARAVGALVGLDAEHVIAQVTPKDKGDVVKRIQLTGRKARSGDAQAYKGRMADERPLRVQPGLLKASKLHRPGGNPFAFTPPSSAATPNGSSASSAFLAVRESQALRSPTNGRHDSDAAERAAHEDDDIALLEEGGKAPASASDDADSVPLSDAVTVLMVGDGINDACSMAVADVGVAIGSGTDIAVETANVVLMRSDLTDVITAIDLSQATLKRIRRNFTWACIYNVMSIPVAAGVLFPVLHVGLPPILAAACMGLSSVSVIVSSLWLKRYRKPIVVDGEGPSGAPQQSATMRSTNIIKKVLSPGLRRNKDGATAGVAVRPSSSSASSSSLSSSSLPRNASALLSASVSQSGYTYAFAAVPHDGDEGEDEHEAVMREILAEGEQQQQQQKLLQAPSSAEEALTPLSPHSAQMAARKTSAASSPSSATAGMRAHRLPAPPVKAKASPSRR